MAKVEIEDTELAELKKQATASAKATALAEALKGELDKAKAGETRLKELEAQAATWAAEKLDATFTAAGIADAKIRKVFQLDFDEQAAEATGEKDLGKWLTGLRELPADKRPAHLAPFLAAPGNVAAGAGQGGAGTGAKRDPVKLPDPNKGAGNPAGSNTVFSPEAVAKMGPEEFRANFAALKAQIPELAHIVLPGVTPASS